MSTTVEPDDVFRAISGAADNDALTLDHGYRLEVGGFLGGSGWFEITDSDDQNVAAFQVTITARDPYFYVNDPEGGAPDA
jgi:hypothetical protein